MLPFKEFIKIFKNKKNPDESILNTVFGEHSRKKVDILNTIFGKHSQENNKKNIKENYYDDHDLTKTEETNLHSSLSNHYNKYEGHHHFAIKEYTEYSKDLNDYLHNRETKPKTTPEDMDHESHAYDLHEALNQHKTPHELHVYSGVKKSPEHLFTHKEGETKKTKADVRTTQFTSTSISKKEARFFSVHDKESKYNEKHINEYDPSHRLTHVLKIHVPKGHIGGYIAHHSAHPEEREFLLPPGTRMSIHHKPTYDGDHHVMTWHAKVHKE